MSYQVKGEQIGSNRPWVAAITGRDPKYGLARSFVAGIRDYSQANRPRTRGVYTTWSLGDGLYQVHLPDSWSSSIDKYLIIRDGRA